MHFTTWLAFATTQLIFALTPGPAVLLVLAQAMARGTRAGWWATLGVQAGNAVYLVLCSVGLGTLLLASPVAFTAIRICGAGYLLWLGVKAIRNAPLAAQGLQGQQAPRLEAPFTQGFAKQLANPKSILFFGALLPQFIDPKASLPLQYLLFAATCAAVEVPILMAYAWLGARGGRLFRNPAQLVLRERLAGMALLLVGSWLFLMRLPLPGTV